MAERRPISDLESSTRFEPADVEPRILAAWLDSGVFHPEPDGDRAETYSIAIPPPNVTGALHMGHALNGTIQDVLIRHARLSGLRTKWILGTDHAGIATQTQVERALAAQGIKREELGRAEFIARVWEWRRRYGSQIIDQFKRLGASCDYSDERFTLDDAYAEAVLRVFVTLFDEGLIYRDNYMVNWDPGSRSAISDLEVEDREETDTLYSIAYPLADGDGEVVVATVRPETMLADTAVAVHPDDERYRALVGREVVLPLVGRRLPIIADDYVKRDFGTGALKITPGHDPNDFELGRRHGLDELSVIGEDGRMTDLAGPAFAGLEVAAARAAVVAALEAEGALRHAEPYTHVVPFSHRSGERIEPLISLQWFMRMDSLAAQATQVVRSGEVRIHPEGQARRYIDWMENLRPWCVSRQLWWGHQLPVWYCDACEETYVAMRAPDRCGACGGELRRDPDVLDTWFSSALWPFATLGWPAETPSLAAFYPTDVLTTARDILFLWVARMVMMGIKFTGQPPFTDVYVHSVIQAPDGRRMSKSLGTGIDPLEEIDRYGADGLRFGLLLMSSTQDVRYNDDRIKQGQALANKLYNASRLILTSVDLDAEPAAQPVAIEDRWILSRLTRIRAATTERIAAFDFAHAALELYDFVYAELCDWYLELIKPRRAGGAARAELSPLLLYVLRETLLLAHPLIPFVTEEIWAYVRRDGEDLLVAARYGELDNTLIDPEAEAALTRTIAATQAMRAWRETARVAPGQVVQAALLAPGYEEVAERIGNLARFAFVDGADGQQPVATIAVPDGQVAVLPVELDMSEYEAHRDRRRAQLQADIDRAAAKLANESFVSRAPDAVVAAERDKLVRLQAELEAL